MENSNWKKYFFKSKLFLALIILFIAIVIIWIIFIKTQKSIYNYEYNISESTSKTWSQALSQTWFLKTEKWSIIWYISDFSWNAFKIINNKNNNIEIWEIINPKDVIITWDNWKISIIFNNNSIIRLNNNSKIEFNEINSKETNVNLLEWELWWRVLKPFYDLSFFSVNTSEISAWVRWTSFFIKKRKNDTLIEVINSYNENEDKKWLTIEYIDPKTNKKNKEILLPKKSITLNKLEKKINKKDIFSEDIFKNPFKLWNLKKDIVYMDSLKKLHNEPNIINKINWEISSTLPKKNEINTFFKEQLIKNNVWVIYSKASISEQDIINNIKKDIIIEEIRLRVSDQILNIKDNKELIKIKNKEASEIKKIINLNEKEIDLIVKKELINLIIKKENNETLYLSWLILINLNELKDQNKKEIIDNLKKDNENVLNLKENIINNIVLPQKEDDKKIEPIKQNNIIKKTNTTTQIKNVLSWETKVQPIVIEPKKIVSWE